MRIIKDKLQSSIQNEAAAIKEESSTMRLSSDSIDNEKENVTKYMNYTNSYFAYLRIGQQSGAIRFYPDADTAYIATIKEADSLLQKGAPGSRTSFVILDSNQNVIYDGEPKKNGKMHFAIYDGKHIEKTISITDIYNTKIKEENKTMKQIKNLTKTTSVTNNQESLDKNKYAKRIKANAKDFIAKGILTPESVDFLCLSKESAHKIARLVQEAAINNKGAEDAKFTKAIQDASLGMVTITKKLASGKATDEKHCSMHDDLLYCVAHCKSYDSLLDGSKGWRKTPGKLDYNKLEDAIVDMYEKGQDKLLKLSQKPKTKIKPDAALPTLDSSVVYDVPKEKSKQDSIDAVVKAISSTIMVYMTSSENTLFYLQMKGLSLESEVKFQTNNAISASFNGKSIIFKTLSGVSKELKIKTRTDIVAQKREVQAILSQLIVCAALSPKTRDLIADVVNFDTIEKFVTTSFNIAA